MPLLRDTKLPPPPEPGQKSLWAYLPRQSGRRVIFLLIALGAVLVLKHSGGWSFGGLLEAPPASGGAPVYHIKVNRPGAANPGEANPSAAKPAPSEVPQRPSTP